MDAIKKRIQSIDISRGIIMAIMALDHTRDFFHITAMSQSATDLDTTTPPIFFTRWITHFCAPVFVLLSGTSIYLQSLRKSKKELAWFLFTRGLWLIFTEITFLTLGWSFNPFFNFIFLQVIWAIGCSMVIFSALIFLRYWAIVAIGIAITLLHNLMDTVSFTDPALDAAANLFLITEYDVYTFGFVQVMAGYAILPWTGIMLIGYGIGKWFNTTNYTFEKRRKTLLISGFGIILLFTILRFINSYGDPSQWSIQRNGLYTFMSFINVSKYPPSLLYACMTIGPALICLTLLEGIQNRFTNIMNIFGRVPFFYYIIHVYIIHFMCVGLFYMEGYTFADNFTVDMAFGFRPKHGFGVSLGVTYVLWVVVLILCYFPSRWYDKFKTKSTKWWVSYI